MAALVAALLIHPTDRVAWRAAALAERSGRPGATLLSAALALALAYGIAGAAGALLGPHLTPEARSLFAALSLLFAGGAALAPFKAPAGGPATLGGFVAMSLVTWGDRAQFVVAAMAARSTAPIAAAAGGTIGALVVITAFAFGSARRRRRLPLLGLRIATGVLLLAVGTVMALGALRLI